MYQTQTYNFLATFSLHLYPSGSDEMPFLYCGECSGAGHECNGDNGPEHHGNGHEEQETCQFVCFCMREAEAFAGNKCRYLIDDFDGDNYTCRITKQQADCPQNPERRDYVWDTDNQMTSI